MIPIPLNFLCIIQTPTYTISLCFSILNFAVAILQNFYTFSIPAFSIYVFQMGAVTKYLLLTHGKNPADQASIRTPPGHMPSAQAATVAVSPSAPKPTPTPTRQSAAGPGPTGGRSSSNSAGPARVARRASLVAVPGPSFPAPAYKKYHVSGNAVAPPAQRPPRPHRFTTLPAQRFFALEVDSGADPVRGYVKEEQKWTRQESLSGPVLEFPSYK